MAIQVAPAGESTPCCSTYWLDFDQCLLPFLKPSGVQEKNAPQE